MVELEWQPMAGGYESGLYRIEPLDDGSNHHWRLITADESVKASGFKTLSVARRAAMELERARIRRSRVVTHLAVGVVAAVVAVGAATAVNSLPTFIVMMVAVWLALRCFVGAVSEQLGDAWSWNRAPGTPRRTTTFDRAWAGVVDVSRAKVVARMGVVGSVPSGADAEPKIRILPPEPPG